MVFKHDTVTLDELAEYFDGDKCVEAIRSCAAKHTDAKTLEEVYLRFFKDGYQYHDDSAGVGLSSADLGSIMKYKLCRGKWRPSLQTMIESNDDELCKEVTEHLTHKPAWYEEPEMDTIEDCMESVTKLKGVGPATASLILSMFFEDLPFFSDELAAFHDMGKISYTHKEYIKLMKRHKLWIEEQTGEEAGRFPYSPRQVEEMIWFWARTHDLKDAGTDGEKKRKEAPSNGRASKRQRKTDSTNEDDSAVIDTKGSHGGDAEGAEGKPDLRSYSDAWIDCHCHFTPPMSQEGYEEKWHAMKEAKFLVPEPYIWTPQATLKYMDEAGIQMQLLSNIPKDLETLKSSNDYGASLVEKYPTRFGLFAALPTDDPTAALSEAKRFQDKCEGFAVTCRYNSTYLSDSKLDGLWTHLNTQKATIFTHPDAYQGPDLGRPSPLLEVAFETARTVVDMLYAGWFTRFPDITVIVSHCGGALPALSGRLLALGTEPWVPNPNNMTREMMKAQLASLYLDTAATGRASHLLPGLEMVGKHHLVYGSDSGVPCSSVSTLEENRKDLLAFQGLSAEEIQGIGRRCYSLFPNAKRRVEEGKK